MDLHDRANVNRVFRLMSKEWGVPVWKVKQILQEYIDQSWEASAQIPENQALWNKYFPDGKPTSEQYVLRLGHARETGEQVPYLL